MQCIYRGTNEPCFDNSDNIGCGGHAPTALTKLLQVKSLAASFQVMCIPHDLSDGAKGVACALLTQNTLNMTKYITQLCPRAPKGGVCPRSFNQTFSPAVMPPFQQYCLCTHTGKTGKVEGGWSEG